MSSASSRDSTETDANPPHATAVTSIAWTDGKVRFIDQTLLPSRECYTVTDDYRVIAEAIRALRIRGAPAIGVAAAFALVLAVGDRAVSSPENFRATFDEAERTLAGTRPTAINLFTALDRMRRAFEQSRPADLAAMRSVLLAEALAIQAEDIEACRKIGELGAAMLDPSSAVLTHCNAGALATAGDGTALSIVFAAAALGRVRRVYVDETRPLLQGARLTSWELLRRGIPTTLITDATAGTVMQRGLVQAVIVGADRIAANGDTANKVGTYPLAVLAGRHNIPFIVAAPTSTIDPATPVGGAIPIEQRAPAEVTHFGGVRIAPENVEVFAPAFDVTPNEFITAIVTEKGVLSPPFRTAIEGLMAKKASGRAPA